MNRRWIWGGLVLFFVLFSLVPAFYELSRMHDVQPNRYFELVHNFYTDYNFYLSRIRQGREGAWTVHEKYTSEPHQGSYIQIMYLLMGKVSAWIGVPWPRSGDTYHVARVVLGATLLFLIAYATKTAFEKFGWQLTAFLLAVTASSWPILVQHLGEWRFGVYMPWWSLNDILLRITFIPHMIAGQALIVFLLVSLASGVVMAKSGNWIFLGLLSFVLGIIFPPGLLFVFGVIGFLIVLDFLYKVRWPFLRLFGVVLAGIISVPSLLYLSLALKIYPWKRLVDFAVLHPQPFVLKDYVLAIGPVLPLGVLGAALVLWKKEKRLFLFVAWAIVWFALIVAFQYIPQESPLRFTEMLPHVPLGILTAYVFYAFYKKTRKYLLLVPAILILLGLGQMYSAMRWQEEFIDHKIIANYPLVPTGSYVMYPLKDMIDAMLWIQDHTSRDTVIFSETTAGNYMPVYSGNTVYVGHANTVVTEQKEFIVKSFFSGQMGPTKAKEFLTINNLRWIFFGPQESSDGGITDLSLAYPFLREAYKNTYFTIYTW